MVFKLYFDVLIPFNLLLGFVQINNVGHWLLFIVGLV